MDTVSINDSQYNIKRKSAKSHSFSSEDKMSLTNSPLRNYHYYQQLGVIASNDLLSSAQTVSVMV